jgi:hypothetical protein
MTRVKGKSKAKVKVRLVRNVVRFRETASASSIFRRAAQVLPSHS